MAQSLLGMMDWVTVYDGTPTTDGVVCTPIDVKDFDHLQIVTGGFASTGGSDATISWQVDYQTDYPSYTSLPASDYAADASTDIWKTWTNGTNGSVTLGSSDATAAVYVMDLDIQKFITGAGGSVRIKYTATGTGTITLHTVAAKYGGTRAAHAGNATNRVFC